MISKIKLLFIIVIIYFLNLCDSQYVPGARYATSSVLTENRLYFIGGFGSDSNGSRNCLDDLFYLNLSKSFNTSTTELPFEGGTKIPERICGSSSSLAEGGKKIYIFGGTKSNGVFSFDINTQQWDKPEIGGTAPERRGQFQMVSDDEKNFLYIFGGLNGDKWFNDMNILSTKDSSWYNMKILGAEKIIIPPYWADFTATMMSSGEIVYIGGRQSTSPKGTAVTFAKMDKIYVFNTKSSSWNIINAGGNVPGSRIGHSAVLASNNRIIVYGGVGGEDWSTPATPDLVILNVNPTAYQWTTPSVKNESPPSRSFHSAAIINKNFMMIAFGNITGSPGATSSLSILDIGDDTNLYWAVAEDVKTSEDIDDKSDDVLTQKIAYILGASIGGFISFVILTIVSVLLYRKWKANKELSSSSRQYLQQLGSDNTT